MKTTVSVLSGKRRYPICIGSGTLKDLGKMLQPVGLGTDAVVITNAGIARRHGSALVAGLTKSGFSVKVMTVPDGEKSKAWESAGVV